MGSKEAMEKGSSTRYLMSSKDTIKAPFLHATRPAYLPVYVHQLPVSARQTSFGSMLLP